MKSVNAGGKIKNFRTVVLCKNNKKKTLQKNQTQQVCSDQWQVAERPTPLVGAKFWSLLLLLLVLMRVIWAGENLASPSFPVIFVQRCFPQLGKPKLLFNSSFEVFLIRWKELCALRGRLSAGHGLRWRGQEQDPSPWVQMGLSKAPVVLGLRGEAHGAGLPGACRSADVLLHLLKLGAPKCCCLISSVIFSTS